MLYAYIEETEGMYNVDIEIWPLWSYHRRNLKVNYLQNFQLILISNNTYPIYRAVDVDIGASDKNDYTLKTLWQQSFTPSNFIFDFEDANDLLH